MYKFELTPVSDNKVCVQVSSSSDIEDVKLKGSVLSDCVGVSEVIGVDNDLIEFETLDSLVGSSITGYGLDTDTIVIGVEQVQPSESDEGSFTGFLKLSKNPVKEVKSAKLIVKRTFDKELFKVQLSLTSLNDLMTCRTTIESGLTSKASTVHLSVRNLN